MDRDATAYEPEPRLSDADALLWSIEKDPRLRSTITSIHLLDRPPDRDRLLRRLERGSRRIPRLRQRVVSLPLSVAPPRWALDPHFDLHYHVRWIRAVGEGTERELFDLAEPIAMQGFDRARPLWELTVVEGLAGGRAAVVTKIHHSITDGIGGRRLLAELVDAERHPAAPAEASMPDAPEAGGARGRRLVAAMADETARQVRGARGAAGSALSSLDRLRDDPVGVATGTVRNLVSVARMLAPAVEPLSPLLAGRSLSVRFGRIDLPRATLERAARLVSGRLNDTILAGLAGGLARHHRRHGHGRVRAVRLAMPLDRLEDRNHPRGAVVTDRFAPMRFTVPLDIDDPLERLAAIRLLVDRERSEPGLGLSAPLANAVNRLPTTVTTALFGSLVRGVDVLSANLDGPGGSWYLAGARIEAHTAFGPLTGAGVAVMSVAGGETVNVGVSMDPAAVADPDTLLDDLSDGFGEILKLV